MAKTKTTFFCQNCGAESPKWQGKCPSCGEWNTYVEEVIIKEDNKKITWQSDEDKASKKSKPVALHNINYQEKERVLSQDQELDRVLGGGIIAGSVTLIGGEPGIGKSTLMLQVALKLNSLRVLYVTGEESEKQVKIRADRMNIKSSNCYILTETASQNIFQQIKILKPELVVIDSVQTLHSSYIDSAAGSISQIRQCTAELIRYAKETGTPVFLIGHITKEGSIAGPKVLEHMVDTVLQFEGDQHHTYRILRTTKNRFGSTSELGIYEMTGTGLREVSKR